MGEPTSEGRKSALKGRLVEGVRLIFIALLATGGFELGASFSEPSAPGPSCTSSSAPASAT